MNKSVIPISISQEIYQYSYSMLKHLPKNALKLIQNELLYSKKLVTIAGGSDRRIHNNDSKVYRTDYNLEDQQDKFGTQIDAKFDAFIESR